MKKHSLGSRIADKIISYSERREADVWIGGRERPYLKRWWVLPRSEGFSTYLHNMLRSDDERAVHDHPYFNISIILRGGYWEVVPVNRRVPNGPTKILWRAPGRIIFRRPTAAHRLVMPNEGPWPAEWVGYKGDEIWTLFITFPRVRDWGFWCKSGWVHWKKFTGADKSGGDGTRVTGPGCGED